MWCSSCQQDVPGIASGGQICCARCGGKLSSGYATTASTEKTAQMNAPPPDTADNAEPLDVEPLDADAAAESACLREPPPVDVENWDLDDELHAAARLVRSLRASGTLEMSPSSFSVPPLDAAHSPTPAWHAAGPARAAQPKRRRRRSSLFSWTMLSLGLMTFACGGVLLGWSLVGGRGELWSLGLPLVLVGQAALIVGLVFQLDSLWQSNRDTSRSLDDLDEQLHDLRHATTMLGTTHSSSARSFYAHLAEGASPQMLLADLKGQMDLLATRLANERR